jgi:Calcineurin-like phosphoesterase
VSLRFRPDHTFTIVQLTDVHWKNGEPEDQRTRALIESVLEHERPDLVALTGDIVDGEGSREPGEAYREVVAPIEARGLPWAAVFGNHDDEGSLSRQQLLDVQRSCRCGLTRRGPRGIAGIGNYVLRIGGGRDGGLAAALYFIDSGAYSPNGVGQYAWITRGQIEWYLRTSRRLAAEHPSGTLPALAFFHIPLPEYDEVWRTARCRGSRHEPVCAPALNSGFFAALVEAGDVMGTFAGHDHVNDFEGELHGIRLCYGRASGFSPYGREGFERGARVIQLQEGERTFRTWLRLADGSRLEQAEHEPDAWARSA